LEKESNECVTNNTTKAIVDNNPLLRFVDGTNLKTIGEVHVDTMHLEDMVVQGNENLSDLVDTKTPSNQDNIVINLLE